MLETKIYDLAIEQSVLAALMTVAESYSEIENLLTEDDFYSTRHKAIFSAVVALDAKNSPYDAVLVNNWLESHDMSVQTGGEQYLMQIMQDSSAGFYNLIPYAEKLKDFTACRKLEAEAQKIILKAPKNIMINTQEACNSGTISFWSFDSLLFP